MQLSLTYTERRSKVNVTVSTSLNIEQIHKPRDRRKNRIQNNQVYIHAMYMYVFVVHVTRGEKKEKRERAKPEKAPKREMSERKEPTTKTNERK